MRHGPHNPLTTPPQKQRDRKWPSDWLCKQLHARWRLLFSGVLLAATFVLHLSWASAVAPVCHCQSHTHTHTYVCEDT